MLRNDQTSRDVLEGDNVAQRWRRACRHVRYQVRCGLLRPGSRASLAICPMNNEAELNPWEVLRLERIEYNQKRLRELGVLEIAADIRRLAESERPKQVRQPRRKPSPPPPRAVLPRAAKHLAVEVIAVCQQQLSSPRQLTRNRFGSNLRMSRQLTVVEDPIAATVKAWTSLFQRNPGLTGCPSVPAVAACLANSSSKPVTPDTVRGMSASTGLASLKTLISGELPPDDCDITWSYYAAEFEALLASSLGHGENWLSLLTP